MSKVTYSVAVVGATGLVGAEIVTALGERGFPLADLRLYASLRSAGDAVQCGALTAQIDPLDDSVHFEGTDIVFLAAGEQVSAEWSERIAGAGAIVVDMSPLFAADVDVPLVVPEVNAADLASYNDRRIVVSPDPVAIALAVVLAPLHLAATVRQVVATTFEPVSGAGRGGIDELQRQTLDLLSGRSTEHTVFPQRIAFAAIPHIGEFLAGGSTRDELHTATALRRLLQDETLTARITRVRVPLFFGSAISVNIETAERLSATDAQAILRAAPGVLLQDDVVNQLYPTPSETIGQDATCVGRIRDADTLPLLDAWIAIDNLRKGAAVNAVQIAELLIRDYL